MNWWYPTVYWWYGTGEIISYTQITDVYAAVIAWMEANGYEPAEPMFNIYHVSPHETQKPDEFVTEICYPIRKK